MDITPLSLNHKKHIKKLRLKKYRDARGLFLAEGMNAFREALGGQHYPVREIIFAEDLLTREGPSLLRLGFPPDVSIYSCSPASLEEISTEEHSRGILLVCAATTFPLENLAGAVPETLIYLDGVADPGNLGTIMRTARWFGMEHILLGPSCVDPFNTKVIRASAGAIFGASLYRNISSRALLSLAREKNYTLAATAPHGGKPLRTWNRKGKSILLLGQESRGLSAELSAMADVVVTIPGSGQAESLNLAAAAAIILYEMTEKRP